MATRSAPGRKMPGGWKGSRGSKTIPPGWEAMRQARKLRAGGRCECPGCKHHAGRCPTPGAELDHHDDNPGNHDPANLRWLCGQCHQVKTLAKAQASRRRERERLKHRSTRARHPGLT